METKEGNYKKKRGGRLKSDDGFRQIITKLV